MTIEEFVEYYGEMIINHGNKMELRADLRSVILGELIRFVNFINNEYCEDITGNMLDKEDVDEFLKDKQ